MVADDLVGEESIKPHSRTINVRIRVLMTREAYAKATGRLVRKPKAKDPMPAIAAVAVMRSRLSSVELALSQC